MDNLLNLLKAEEWIEQMIASKEKKAGTLMSYCFSTALFLAFLADKSQKKVFTEYTSKSTLRDKSKSWKALAGSLQKDKKMEAITLKELGYSKLTFARLDRLKIHVV